MNKQQLATKIWESANRMRSKIEANEYKDYILGFIFYKYLSEREVKFLKSECYTDDMLRMVNEENDNVVTYVQENIGFFISYENLFSTWLEMGKDFDVSNVRDALSAFSRLIYGPYKRVFAGIFDTLQIGLSKLGDSAPSQTKAISALLNLIKDIPMDGKQDYDVLGFIYEFLIEKFAANAGKKAGEFYTPHEVSVLMAEIVSLHLSKCDRIRIYDPTSGSGSLLINIGRCASKYLDSPDRIMYYAQELNQNTYNLTRMNLVMRGIKPDNIFTRNKDTLQEDWPCDPDNEYAPLYVDAVVSNPPYSQAWDPTDKETDPRYARFGLAPKGKADYAFLLHDLYHIKPDGIMTIVLPHGVLFRGGEEGVIRKNLIENNHIDTIIGLPANIFFGTGIPTIIMVLKQKRENTDLLMIDASKGFIKDGKNNKLRASDIKRIVDTVQERRETERYSRTVSREEIRKNDYNLNIPRYVDSSEQAESWDIYASMFGGIPMKEIDGLRTFWDAFPGVKRDLFTPSEIPYVRLAVDNVKKAVKGHEDIRGFERTFRQAFDGFREYLREELIGQRKTVSVSREEGRLSGEIFRRMEGVPLLDPYEAYQLLDDAWSKIAVDLEMIQTEGEETEKKVEPKLVIKKKDGKEVEVQEGWMGHILPFALVQETYLKEECEMLHQKEQRLAEMPAEYEEVLDSLTEEEKGTELLNEAGDSFQGKEVSKKLKELKGAETEEERELERKLLRVDGLMKEEKELRAQIKKDSAELHNKTRQTLESLSGEQVEILLEKKWIDSFLSDLATLPERAVDDFIKRIEALKEKYASTYFEIEEEIQKTEKILCGMIDELDGNEFDMKGLGELKALLMGE